MDCQPSGQVVGRGRVEKDAPPSAIDTPLYSLRVEFWLK